MGSVDGFCVGVLLVSGLCEVGELSEVCEVCDLCEGKEKVLVVISATYFQ